MVIELMLISGFGFSAIVGVALTGAVDEGAEKLKIQEEGEYEKWKNKNEFKLYDLVDMPAFVQDVKDESSYMIDWKKMELEAAEKEAAEKAASAVSA